MKIDIKSIILEGASKLLLSNHLWTAVKRLCLDAANNDKLDNAAKHAAVKKDLKIIFEDTSSIVLNLAIELGTLYVSITYPQLAPIVNTVATQVETDLTPKA